MKVIYMNTKILYGKNASSNNELTFKVANKDDYYLHIKDYHGAHAIIKNNKPTNEEKLLAAEICLILSNKTAGEVMIASMKEKGNEKEIALLNARGDSIHLQYKKMTRQMAANLKEGVLHDFLAGRFPTTYKKKLPDGRIVTINADTNEEIPE